MNYTSTMQSKTNGRSLPKGWQWANLADVCERMTNGTSATQNTLGKGLPVTRIETISSGSIDMNRVGWIDANPEELEKYILSSGDILFSHINSFERLGNCAIYAGQPSLLIHGMNLLRIQAKREVIDSSYLFFYFKSQGAIEYFRQNARRAIGQASLNTKDLSGLPIPLPPLDEQRRIASRLNEQLAAVESARKAAEEQLELSNTLINAYLKVSLSGSLRTLQLMDGFVEVKKGIGKTWADYPLLGTTRYGVAPAKEKVGKKPERYKLVEPGTIFYNPMRINIGSIGMLDEGDVPGITSPDYVVINAVKGVIDPRWFYYWLRSPYGEAFIKTLARGAVRERMMFTRLAPAYLDIPSYEVQAQIAEKLLGIKQLQSAIESQLDEIDRLPASLLHSIFDF